MGAAAATPKPAGLELKVTFQDGVSDTQAAYAALAQELGGMLCGGASVAPRLAVMAALRVGWRLSSHPPPSAAAAATAGPAGSRQIYAWLPQEALCTENLAAWRRLLPCQQHAGLAALLRPVQLAAAGYASLGLELWAEPAASTNASQKHSPTARLRHVLTAVLPPLPAAGAGGGGQQAMFQATFGTALPAACPAASVSRLHAALVGGAGAAGTAPADGCSLEQTLAGPLLACNAAQADKSLPAGVLQAPTGPPPQAGAEAALQVVQHVVQHGTRDGTLVVGVQVAAAGVHAAGATEQAGDACSSNSSSSGSGPLLHLVQLLPWQLVVRASSLRVELDGQVRRDATAVPRHGGQCGLPCQPVR